MKTISIRFNDHIANWIMGNCQKNKITISEFIRDLLYSKMQHGQIDHKLKINKQKYMQPQNYRTEMGYIIFAAKLIEGLVLATQEQGAELRNTAFQETEKLLEQLNLNNKEQRFCISLEGILFEWLSQESVRLQLKIVPLIRMLVKDAAIVDNYVIEQKLSRLQKVAIEHQLIACKLLEEMIKHIGDNNADNIIEEARSKTKDLMFKLEQSKQCGSLTTS